MMKRYFGVGLIRFRGKDHCFTDFRVHA
jgi:hypothetical protein